MYFSRAGSAATISCRTLQSAPGTPLGMQRQRSRFSSFISLQMWSLSTLVSPRMRFWNAETAGPAPRQGASGNPCKCSFLGTLWMLQCGAGWQLIGMPFLYFQLVGSKVHACQGVGNHIHLPGVGSMWFHSCLHLLPWIGSAHTQHTRKNCWRAC